MLWSFPHNYSFIKRGNAHTLLNPNGLSETTCIQRAFKEHLSVFKIIFMLIFLTCTYLYLHIFIYLFLLALPDLDQTQFFK